ncbi:MAG: MBL fold metallo-hydrolase [Marinilabiliaceae bacterium]|nr:MBL fold metallo-hydrolase [Marinilabiliaceae bacterium]
MIGCNCIVCSSNNPKDARLRSSVLIETGGKRILIDAGPDFRQQMLNYKVTDLDAILLTHEHSDHVSGLDDVRSINWIHGKPIPIYGEQRVLDDVKTRFYYAFTEKKYPGVPKYDLNPIDEKPFSIYDIDIFPIRVFHHKLAVLGFRIGDFVYITDASRIEQVEKEKMKGAKHLVINGLRFEEHISHYTLPQAIEVIKCVQPETAWITHISHQLGLHDEIESQLPDNIHLAYDGLLLEW